MVKTGVIKDLVVTEESGIAKGIRRVTAVTGHEAYEVNRVAEALTAKFDLIEKKSGKDKDAALKAYTLVRIPLTHRFDTISENGFDMSSGAQSGGYIRPSQGAIERPFCAGTQSVRRRKQGTRKGCE